MNYAVILAGGTGTRFWPFSREIEPKQFLNIIGKESLLQETILRVKKDISIKNIYIVTNKHYRFELEKQIKRFAIPQKNIIFEPEGKNTAPAIGLCAQIISRIDKNAFLIVLPSDHYIKDSNRFRKCLKMALKCAKNDYLVTIGIKPSQAKTGYGYIEIKGEIDKKNNCFKVSRFLEKPQAKIAKKYCRDKNYFWNSGIFVWKAQRFLDELKIYQPKLHSQLTKINSEEDIEKNWHNIKAISVDYGLLEYSKNIALIKGNFRWSDLGSWDALNDLLSASSSANVIKADSIDLGSRGICVISMAKRLISTIGLKHLIIADTPDALLICDKSKSQEVKKIVERLKKSKRSECSVHLKEKRPWGSFTVLQSARGFKIKLIEIDPKKRISLQKHFRRTEHWVVVSGKVKVLSANKIKIVSSNQSIYIPKGTIHRLINHTNSCVKIVEVQTGDYLEEDDIERFQDDFKR